MAILGNTTLTGCTSIPAFIASGQRMIFWMATPPTSWTKDTGALDGMLRVVTGSVSPRSGSAFGSVFASRPVSGTTTTNPINITGQGPVAGFSMTLVDGFWGSGNTPSYTLPQNEIVPHAHGVNGQPGGAATPHLNSTTPVANPQRPGVFPANTTGGGGGHVHGATYTHNHPGTYTSSSHVHTIPGDHSHPWSSTVDVALTYVDFVIASKD